jgi:S-adenosylmethionine:tRNA ribosyltransferase-isomerase
VVSESVPTAPVEAHEPPEVRGTDRADVRMMVTERRSGVRVHARFRELERFLRPGDLLAVNVSATLPAALPARLGEEELELHLSTPARDGSWAIELRTADLLPYRRPPIGTRLELPGGAHAELVAPYLGSRRLGLARLALGEPVEQYLHRHGHPIRYGYVGHRWPIEAYQTVFAREGGSAEMPSAGRPFTADLVVALICAGVLVAPITLHTGVSSLDRGEAPYPERYRVPATTARLVNAVHDRGGRVIAVGTTVVRALETVAARDGVVAAGHGSTDLVVTPERDLRTIDGLLTGWHDPASSHVDLLRAAAGAEALERSSAAAQALGYRFHEFGDTHLILP